MGFEIALFKVMGFGQQVKKIAEIKYYKNNYSQSNILVHVTLMRDSIMYWIGKHSGKYGYYNK